MESLICATAYERKSMIKRIIHLNIKLQSHTVDTEKCGKAPYCRHYVICDVYVVGVVEIHTKNGTKTKFKFNSILTNILSMTEYICSSVIVVVAFFLMSSSCDEAVTTKIYNRRL